MRLTPVFKILAAAALAASLAACVTHTGAPRTSSYPATYPGTTSYPYPAAAAPAPAYVQYGRVSNVEFMRTQQPGSTSGAGAVLGGVVGGVLGHQIGKGTGRDVATVAGAVGGALVGNTIERNRAPGSVSEFYRVSVQLDNGTMRAFDYATAPNVRIGDRVRIENDQLYR